MKKIPLLLIIFLSAGVLLWAFPFFSVAVSAPTQVVDLAIRKSDYPDPVIAGNALTYTLAITNSGDLLANGVAITDTLPGQVSFNAASPECNFDSQTGKVRCDLVSLEAQASTLVTITVQVNPSARGIMTNTASTNPIEVDINPTNNTVTETTTIDASADLGINKSDIVDQVMAGENVSYTYAITVTNGGPSLATGVVVTDTWLVDFTRGPVEWSQGSCDTSASITDFTCDVGNISAGDRATITVTYSVPAETPSGMQTNTVEASSTETTGSVSASHANTVVTTANLGISKDDGVSQVTAGENVSYAYAITVMNGGPSLATGVVVTDTWPAEFTRVNVVSSQGTCGPPTGTTDFTCDVGDIPAGEHEAITVTYSVPSETPAGDYTNIVEADAVDASAPATDTDVNTVLTVANLDISKSDGASQVTAGDGVTYQYAITVMNGGPSLATGVVVTDTWPLGFERGTVDWSQGGCNTSTSETDFTCTVGDIPVGERATITATYSVPPGTPSGMQTNTAEANGVDASALITVTDETSVNTEADLSLEKLDDPDPVIFGDLVTYTLNVANSGPSNAIGVVISDTLPAGTAFDAQSAPPECTAMGSIVTCILGNIVDGGSDQVVFRANVLTTGTLTNRASVHASTDDPAPTDNSAQVMTTVQEVVNPPVHWSEPVPTGFSYFVDCQTVHLEVIDDDPVQRVEFQRWDHVQGVWIPLGSDYSSPYTRELDTCMLPYGFNQIWAWAYDALNQRFPGIRIFLVKPARIYLPLMRK